MIHRIEECSVSDSILIGRSVVIQFLDSTLRQNIKLIDRMDREMYQQGEAIDACALEKIKVSNELTKKKKTSKWQSIAIGVLSLVSVISFVK